MADPCKCRQETPEKLEETSACEEKFPKNSESGKKTPLAGCKGKKEKNPNKKKEEGKERLSHLINVTPAVRSRGETTPLAKGGVPRGNSRRQNSRGEGIQGDGQKERNGKSAGRQLWPDPGKRFSSRRNKIRKERSILCRGN